MAAGGKRPGAGRKKGIANKTTRDMKDALYQAFEEKGGVRFLCKLADDEPKTFAMLLAKLIPQEIKADVTVSNIGDRLERARARILTEAPENEPKRLH